MPYSSDNAQEVFQSFMNSVFLECLTAPGEGVGDPGKAVSSGPQRGDIDEISLGPDPGSGGTGLSEMDEASFAQKARNTDKASSGP